MRHYVCCTTRSCNSGMTAAIPHHTMTLPCVSVSLTSSIQGVTPDTLKRARLRTKHMQMLRTNMNTPCTAHHKLGHTRMPAESTFSTFMSQYQNQRRQPTCTITCGVLSVQPRSPILQVSKLLSELAQQHQPIPMVPLDHQYNLPASWRWLWLSR